MKEATSPMPNQGRRELVYVVDDEPVIALTTTMILCAHGFDARAFTDPLAALQAARSESPNLLLSDVIMPGLNGFELTSGVIEDCPQCKVLLFSGNPGVRENHATSGKNLEILMKPIMPADLVHAVRNKLDA